MSAVTLVAATGYMAQQAQYGYSAFSSSDKSNQQMYGSLNSYAAKRYQASKQARDHSYVLTNVTEGKTTGVGLLAISLATGEPGAQVLLNDKEPEYAVDELTGRLYYFNDKKQVQVFALK
jgi:hypothetical protein